MVPINWLFKEPTSPSSWPWHCANTRHVKQISASVNFDWSIRVDSKICDQEAWICCMRRCCCRNTCSISINQWERSHFKVENSLQITWQSKRLNHAIGASTVFVWCEWNPAIAASQWLRTACYVHNDGSKRSHITAASASSSLENSCWLAACWSSTWQRSVQAVKHIQILQLPTLFHGKNVLILASRTWSPLFSSNGSGKVLCET